jgi:hypothetical protein
MLALGYARENAIDYGVQAMKTLLPLLALALGVISSVAPRDAHATCQSADCRVELVDADCKTTNGYAPEEQRTVSSKTNVTFVAYCMRYCYPPDGSPGTESLDYQPPADVLTVKDADGADIDATFTQTDRVCNELPVFSVTSLPVGPHRIWFPGQEEGTGGGLPIVVSDKPAQNKSSTEDKPGADKNNTPETGGAPVPELEIKERSGRCSSASPALPATPASMAILLLGVLATLRRARETR